MRAPVRVCLLCCRKRPGHVARDRTLPGFSLWHNGRIRKSFRRNPHKAFMGRVRRKIACSQRGKFPVESRVALGNIRGVHDAYLHFMMCFTDCAMPLSEDQLIARHAPLFRRLDLALTCTLTSLLYIAHVL